MFDLIFYNDLLKITKYILKYRAATDRKSENVIHKVLRGKLNETDLFRKDRLFLMYVTAYARYWGYREFLFCRN